MLIEGCMSLILNTFACLYVLKSLRKFFCRNWFPIGIFQNIIKNFPLGTTIRIEIHIVDAKTDEICTWFEKSVFLVNETFFLCMFQLFDIRWRRDFHIVFC